MTEQEWLTSDDPQRMLNVLTGQWVGASAPYSPATDRKLRLFACACARDCWDDMPMDARSVVESVEEVCDKGIKTPLSVLMNGAEKAHRVAWNASPGDGLSPQFGPSIWAMTACLPEQRLVDDNYHGIGLMQSVTSEHASLIRDIFGNPFRPLQPFYKKPSSPFTSTGSFEGDSRLWGKATFLTETVLRIAQSIYAERAFDRMPVLADALEEAGCREESVLRHLRKEITGKPRYTQGRKFKAYKERIKEWESERGPHVRGCWVIDLLLGKQ